MLSLSLSLSCQAFIFEDEEQTRSLPPNPFSQLTEKELEEYKNMIEQKQHSQEGTLLCLSGWFRLLFAMFLLYPHDNCLMSLLSRYLISPASMFGSCRGEMLGQKLPVRSFSLPLCCEVNSGDSQTSLLSDPLLLGYDCRWRWNVCRRETSYLRLYFPPQSFHMLSTVTEMNERCGIIPVIPSVDAMISWLVEE